MRHPVILFSAAGIAAFGAGIGAFEIPTRFAGSSYVDRCEDMILGNIRTPATYQAVSRESDGGAVVIWFDAQNQNGALVRTMAACRFADDALEFGIIGDDPVRESLLTLY